MQVLCPKAQVDDAYRLALPGGLPAGSYSLAYCLHPMTVDALDCAPEQTYLAGSLNVPADLAPPPVSALAQPMDASFGGAVRLTGYQLRQNGVPVMAAQRYVPARPGDVLEYTLDWQALRPEEPSGAATDAAFPRRAATWPRLNAACAFR